MYVETVPNRNSAPPFSCAKAGAWQERAKDHHRHLTHWPRTLSMRCAGSLAGRETGERRGTLRHRAHGALRPRRVGLATIRRLGLDSMIASERSRQRDLVVAMIASRVLTPCSKLATTRLWRESALAEDLSVQDADVDELYDALDWLLARQRRSRRNSRGAISPKARRCSTIFRSSTRGEQVPAGGPRPRPRRQARHAHRDLRRDEPTATDGPFPWSLPGQHGRPEDRA